MCKFCKLCNCFSNKSAINPTGNKMSVNGNDYLNHAIAKAMWIPSKSNINMMDFLHVVNETYDVKLEMYRELWKWSVENYSDFWKEVWKFCDVIHSKPFSRVVDILKPINENPEWFNGAAMNYAENILRYNDEKFALIGAGEGQSVRKVTYKDLHSLVALYASGLEEIGIKTGDRVVGYMPNCIETVLFMLATASLGAIWSSTSPDFGVSGVLDRFQQISPKVIISVEAVQYNSKIHNHLGKLRQVVLGLSDLKHVIVVPFVTKNATDIDLSSVPKSMSLDKFIQQGNSSRPLEFKQLPFNHPLFVMYSSGTTGPPKCMVHSAGGTLIQHMKEHILHGNMGRDDVLLYYTTTGWMMWNWLVGGLTSGGTIVLYDGSPFHPKSTVLFDLVDNLGITILGTSAKCLDLMQSKDLRPCETHKLKYLHTVLSTGSPLTPQQYDYVYKCIKPDVLLGSITGGTDIISCFISQNWNVPVYRGQLQSANLGMAVYSYEENEDGTGSPIYGRPGELVCTKPFPCMPIYFWNDKDNVLYKKAYFSKFPGVWSHGDFCIEDENTHGFIMLGRSDATLNPNGVRFGSSELYAIIETQFRKEISDSLAVAQRPRLSGKESDVNTNERVILFVKMCPDVEFNQQLADTIRKTIRTLISPRHVPEVVLETEDIPYTISGKKVEIAVTKILAGMDVKHTGAFRNPESLDLYKNIAALQNY